MFLGTSGATAFDSDDFDRKNLDTARWTFVDPLGDGWIRMTGAGTGSARVELSVPQGASHDPFHTNRSVRIMQPIADADFVLTAGFESEPTERFQLQGLLFEASASSWIRFDVRHDGDSLRLYSGVTVGGSTSPRIDEAILPGDSRYLRISRTGDDWTLEYSADGNLFFVAGSYTHALAVTSAGVFVANHSDSGDSPAFTATVDWVELASAPLVDEDAQTSPDLHAPFIHRIETQPGPGGLAVSWRTDEPAEGRVEFGETPLYELGSVTGESGVFLHTIELPGLVAGRTYHYKIHSTDELMHGSMTGDFQVTFDPDGPVIELFYGDGQAFGSIGQTQPWVNILGSTSDPSGVATLVYSLNAGPELPLMIGPDERRLAWAGDFNVDLDVTNLLAGPNALEIAATDAIGNETRESFTFDYTPATRWPLPFSIDWSTLLSDDEIQDVAQVVDGHWFLDAGTVRTAERGYDRLIAFGDRTWTDYEFVVPITRFNTPGSSGVGVLLRWDGHTDAPVVCSQPKCGWLPLGAILWARPNRLEIYGNDGIIYASTPRILTDGVTYWYKGRVETKPEGSLYSFKVWEDGQPEPVDWDIVGQAGPSDPQQGSLMLITHWSDASFGNVTVTDLSPPENVPPVANDDSASSVSGGAIEIAVLANDVDPDGTLDPATVVLQDLPMNGTAIPDPSTGHVVYVHDGSSTMSDGFSYTVDDALGASSNVGTVELTFTPEIPQSIASDDFNRTTLDTDLWTFVTPLGDGEITLVGAGSGDASLRLSLPAGTPHDVWGTGGINESVRVMQESPDVDLDLEVKWNAEPTDGFNTQGILIEQDPDNFLRFEVTHTGSTLLLRVGKTIGGTNSILLEGPVPAGSTLYMRVVRTGDDFTVHTSSDGEIWISHDTVHQPLEVARVGVFAANPIQGLAFTSEVDYFQNNAAAIPDEDANRIEVEIVGRGNVTLDPDLPTYAIGEIVALTPWPAPTGTFLGWSGDLAGSDVPAQLTVTESMRVTAIFSAPAVPGLGPSVGIVLGALLTGFGVWRLRESMRTRAPRSQRVRANP
jgi:regulation of enolase protein 1 (concanavalin A-like superfamily)